VIAEMGNRISIGGGDEKWKRDLKGGVGLGEKKKAEITVHGTINLKKWGLNVVRHY